MNRRFNLNGNDWERKDFLGEDWVWRDAEKRGTKDIRWWRGGEVPGTVANDCLQAEEIPDPYFEKNSLLIEWIPERTWIYRKKFQAPDLDKGQELTLHFEGVDYEAVFYLNEVCLGSHASMYTPVSFRVTDLIEFDKENQVTVVLQKAPDEQPQVSKTSYVKTHKSRMTYWWDFCPRMIHQGIWDDVYLEAHGSATIQDLYVRTGLSDGKEQAELSITTTVHSDCRQWGTLFAAIFQNGEKIGSFEFETELFEGENKLPSKMMIENPRLWWPNGYGDQPLYELCAELKLKNATISSEIKTISNEIKTISHEKKTVFGIRELCFEANEGAELTADHYVLKVNGRRIYVKGWNWVPMDVMYGVKRPEKLEHLLTLAKEANVNMLRVWGGGLIEREDFYEHCDRMGLLVWQEFIQSSSGIDNQPSTELTFIDFMTREAEAIIPRKRNHPALALWCGGNELQSGNQSMIKESEPVILALRRVAAQLDPDRKFLASSPTGRIFNNDLALIEKDPTGLHDVHGPWEHQGLVAQYTLYNRGTSLFSSEYGVEGMTNRNTLYKSMREEKMWPPSRDNDIYFHRGSWWNNYPLVQSSFGDQIEEIGRMIQASQFLQYEGLRYAVESNRRRAFANSGSMMWQFNEPYPNNYCTCAVDYYGQPKPAYYGVAQAYEPVQLTAAFVGQSVAGLDTFEAEVFGHNSLANKKELEVTARIIGDDGTVYYDKKERVTLTGESERLFTVTLPLSKVEQEIFYLVLTGRETAGGLITDHRYLFTKEAVLTGLLNRVDTPVAVTMQAKTEGAEKGCFRYTITLTNEGRLSVPGLKLESSQEPDQKTFLRFSENYCYLLPGETKTIGLQSNRALQEGELQISGFGLETNKLFMTK